MLYVMRHADPRTTMRYDMAKANLDRHAAHAVAAYLAGMSTGRGATPGGQANGTGILSRFCLETRSGRTVRFDRRPKQELRQPGVS
jgi:hypothetical protein